MNLKTKQDIESGILVALGLLLWAWFQQDWLYVSVAGAVLGGALILPIVFRPIAWLWFGLSRVLGYVMSHVLLTIIFYLVVVPVGIIRKWMDKDSLQLDDFKKSTGSVLKHRDHTYQPEDLKHPF